LTSRRLYLFYFVFSTNKKTQPKLQEKRCHRRRGEREIQWLAGRSLTDPKKRGNQTTKKNLNKSNKQAYHSFKIS